MTKLYLITPPKIQLSVFVEQARQALETGGVAAFQLRLKDASDDEILRAGEALLPICQAHDVTFILNDRPDLALKMGADGVHLGQEDLEKTSITQIRNLIGPDKIIGVSCHASRHLAMEAGEQGADYVAFGAFYPTNTKPKEKLEKWGTPKPDIIKWWQEVTVIPSVAIGGITPENCTPVVAAGADFIAVVTGVWNDPDGPAAAVNKFNRAIGVVLG